MLKKCLIAGIVIAVGTTGGMFYSDDIRAERPTNTSPKSDETTILPTREVSQDKLVLESKGEDYVLVCQRRFEVTSGTVIKNKFGVDISFGELSVPCEAMVSYYKKPRVKNTYVAVSIEVQGEPEPQPE